MTTKTNIDLTGFKELQDLLEKFPDDMAAKSVRKAFYAGAKLVRDEAKSNCPVGETGELRDAIRIVKPSKDVRANTLLIYIVRCKHWLSHIVEYGTVKRQRKSGGSTGAMPAHSFMRKTADEQLETAIGAIQKSCQENIEKSAVELAKRVGAVK